MVSHCSAHGMPQQVMCRTFVETPCHENNNNNNNNNSKSDNHEVQQLTTSSQITGES